MAIGDKVRDRDWRHHRLCLQWFGPEFGPFISSIHSQPKMTVKELFHLLVQEDQFIKGQQGIDAITTAPSSVLVTHSRYNSCSDHNHNSGHGKSPQDNSKSRWRKTVNNYTKSRNKVACQLCDSFGNSAKNCKKGLKAFVAMSIGDDREDANDNNTWILDSNASNHMALDVSSLTEVHEYLGKNSIIIGNGLGLPITPFGIASIPSLDGSIKLKTHCVFQVLK